MLSGPNASLDTDFTSAAKVPVATKAAATATIIFEPISRLLWWYGLANWRPLELDNIAFGVRYVDGRSFPLCTIAPSDRTRFNPMGFKMVPNVRFIEWFDPNAEMIQIAPRFAGGRTTEAS